MQAIVTSGIGSIEVLSLQEVPTPVPKTGEIRIRIKAAGFNPVDWKMRQGWYQQYGDGQQQILGSDCSGIVDAVGPQVSDFSIGDEVYAMPFMQCSNGSYAEYTCVPSELAYKKPSHLTFEEAAVIPLAAMTAYRLTLAFPGIKKEGAVFIAGVGGGVGPFVLQMVRSLGVQQIYTLAKDEKSARFLQQNLGFSKDHIVLYQDLSYEELKEKLLSLAGHRLFDATIDLVGGEIKRLCLELTGYSGYFSTVLPEKNFAFPTWDPAAIPRMRNVAILQVMVGAELFSSDRSYWKIYSRHLKEITHLLEKRILTPPQIEVVGPFSVETARKAHTLLENRSVKGKLVMSPV